VKKRVWLAKGYGSFQSARRTLQGIETVHMIRKGRVSCPTTMRLVKHSSLLTCSASWTNRVRPLIDCTAAVLPCSNFAMEP
jgi:hypothetical protein